MEVRRGEPIAVVEHVLRRLERQAIDAGSHPVLIHEGMEALDRLREENARLRDADRESAVRRNAALDLQHALLTNERDEARLKLAKACPVHEPPHVSHDCAEEIVAWRAILTRERDEARADRDIAYSGWAAAKKLMEQTEAKLARCVEALGEIRGRSLAAKTHEVGPLEAKGRLTRILELACAALAAAKGE